MYLLYCIVKQLSNYKVVQWKTDKFSIQPNLKASNNSEISSSERSGKKFI